MPRQRPISRTVHQKRVLAMVRIANAPKCVPRTFYIPRGIADERADDFITRNMCNPGERVAYHKSIELVNVTYQMSVQEFLQNAQRTEITPQTKEN